MQKPMTCRFFVFQFLEDASPSCAAIDTPVLDFWLSFLWLSKPEWAALFTLGGGACIDGKKQRGIASYVRYHLKLLYTLDPPLLKIS